MTNLNTSIASKLNKSQIADFKADAFARAMPPDDSGFIQVWVDVRRDEQIPSFDAIANVSYYAEGLEVFDDVHEGFFAMLGDGMGMFVDDVFALKESDVVDFIEKNRVSSNLSASIKPSESNESDNFSNSSNDFNFIPALRALKKALADYLNSSGQADRLRAMSEKIVCSCRNVSDFEIADAVKRGKTTFELVKKFTGAGASCGACRPRVEDVIKKSLIKSGVLNEIREELWEINDPETSTMLKNYRNGKKSDSISFDDFRDEFAS